MENQSITSKRMVKWCLVVFILLCGCAPNFCNTKSPEYDYARCREYTDRLMQNLQQQQNWQMQQQINQLQFDASMQRIRNMGYRR